MTRSLQSGRTKLWAGADHRVGTRGVGVGVGVVWRLAAVAGLAGGLAASGSAWGQAIGNVVGGAGIDVVGEEFALTLGGLTFDPAGGEPALPLWLREDGDDGSARFGLLQVNGPLSDGERGAMEGAGVEVVRYVWPHAYVIWGTGEARADAAAALGGRLRYAGAFHPAYKLTPEHRGLDGAERRTSVLVSRAAVEAGRDVRGELEALGAKADEPRVLDAGLAVVDVFARGDALAEIARLTSVYSVQVAPTDGGNRAELTAQLAARNTVDGLATPGYSSWLGSVGVDGSGVIVASVDDGMNQNHLDLVNRVVACSGPTCGGAEALSHGTHTAGIIAGDGSSGVLDSAGFLRGQGVAPGANLVEQYYVPVFQSASGVFQLMTDSVRNGAVISSNSWGTSSQVRGYDASTMQLDIGARDADPAAAGNQELLYVLAIDNGFGGFQTIGAPDEAKNALTVGSQVGQSGVGMQSGDWPDLSTNSGHGPTSDGRAVPLIVAPGCQVDSTGLGQTHFLDCGTSMAAPHVAGAAALFTERYRLERFGLTPSPAMMKAGLLVGAESLAGAGDADGVTLGQPLDSKQGWGALNMSSSVGLDWSTTRLVDQSVVFDGSGEEWSLPVTPADPSAPVRVMLVWTDAPGHGLGGATPAWNNDLDLVVEVGVDEYLGNNIGAGGWSALGGTRESRNNTEGVVVPGSVGPMTVRVRAQDVNSDGVPGFGDSTDQDFAVIVTNVVGGPGFELVLVSGAERVCAPSDAAFTIEAPGTGGFTGDVALSAEGLAPGLGVTFSENPAPAGTTVTATLGGTGGFAGGVEVFEVVGTTAGEERRLTLGVTIDAGAAAAPGLSSPAAGASGQSRRPVFEWAGLGDVSGYRLQVAMDAGFANVVVDETLAAEATTFQPTDPLEAATSYFWRVRGENACGAGAWSATRSFATARPVDVLLVDDDDNSPDVRGTYTAALDALGVSYDVWDTENSDQEPTAAQLSAYRLVVWFTGDEFGGFAGPSATSETAIAAYLDGGGCFLISSQEYLFDRGGGGLNPDNPTPLMLNYLGADEPSNSDVGQTSVTGQGTLFSGIGATSLSYPYTNYSDEIVPTADGEVAFIGNEGPAGTAKITPTYTAVYLGFPIEALPTASARRAVLAAMVDRCAPLCQGDANGDKLVNADDLLIVLGEFGTAGGLGDLNDSGNVDANDLLFVLGKFGTDCLE